MPIRLQLFLAAALAAGILAYFLLRPSPKQIFTKEVVEMIATANRGEHPALADRVSANLTAVLESEFLTPHSALRVAQNTDKNQGRQYRLDDVPAFAKQQDATIRFTRSGPDGNYNEGASRYSMDFIWEDKQWKAESLPSTAPQQP